jgi:hypothetical protein
LLDSRIWLVSFLWRPFVFVLSLSHELSLLFPPFFDNEMEFSIKESQPREGIRFDKPRIGAFPNCFVLNLSLGLLSARPPVGDGIYLGPTNHVLCLWMNDTYPLGLLPPPTGHTVSRSKRMEHDSPAP